ncbi:MAG: diaminopimelate epimerase [Vicinamibacterales bacterium]
MLDFWKAHAYGNDFLYVRQDDVEHTSLAGLARQMCDRHTGVGADGLIVFEGSGNEVHMRLFNADGSRAEVSGNGVRALGALLLRDDTRPGQSVAIHTDAGVKRLTKLAHEGTLQTFRASMGAPAGIERILPFEIAGATVQPVVLSMGNPQCVIVGPLPDDDAFRRIGAALERHELFPEGTNVEFADVEAPDRVRILIWERGVGPTSSSGTGSCAALVACASFGGAEHVADVIAPGGPQRVEWLPDAVYLTGWAEVLCSGEWCRDLPD